ncbi:hypothetical protein LZK73_21945 [Neorhizobium galegae]|nr:hypothetical protein LZK73_21945 [Neorhizobium galegae]
MFNISMTRVGGLRFLKVSRITITMSVTRREAYLAKQLRAAQQATLIAMMELEVACVDAMNLEFGFEDTYRRAA